MHGFKHGVRYTAGRLFAGSAIAFACLLMAGCPGKDKAARDDPSQVAVQVNDSEISIHQVQAVLQAQPQLAAQLGDAAPGRVLDSLIEQELAAQGARANGLDNAPKVIQAMELAKREVLARAYQDMLADKVVLPDSKSIDEYYEAHPELFAHRRQYTLQETLVRGTPEQVKALMAKVNAAKSAGEVGAAVAESGLSHSARVSVQWAEGLPMDLLPKLASLQNGQSIGVGTPAGVTILTVMASQEVPITRAAADKAIKAALISGKREELVKQGMEELRRKATISRKGAFAAPAGASDTSPASQAASGS